MPHIDLKMDSLDKISHLIEKHNELCHELAKNLSDICEARITIEVEINQPPAAPATDCD